MRTDSLRLRELLSGVIEAMGYELVGVEYHPHGPHPLLRVYIDREGGVDVEDCGRVSHQVSGLLDVEDPIPGNYTLEVSSPGLDRPLFQRADFQRYAGAEVRIQMALPVDGRRRFLGVLAGLDGEDVLLDVQGVGRLRLPLDGIEKARLVPAL